MTLEPVREMYLRGRRRRRQHYVRRERRDSHWRDNGSVPRVIHEPLFTTAASSTDDDPTVVLLHSCITASFRDSLT